MFPIEFWEVSGISIEWIDFAIRKDFEFASIRCIFDVVISEAVFFDVVVVDAVVFVNVSHDGSVLWEGGVEYEKRANCSSLTKSM